MHDPWAPPGEAVYEPTLSPHEQRLWEACAAYDQQYGDLASLVEAQRQALVQYGRRADMFGVDAGQLVKSYNWLAQELPDRTLASIDTAFDETNLLLAQHGPDAALWAQVRVAAAQRRLLPYELLQQASSYASERAMRVGLDGFVWNRAASTAGNPPLLEQVIAEASSPALGRLLQLIFDDRPHQQLAQELTRPRLRTLMGNLALQRLSPRSQQLAQLSAAWSVQRAARRSQAMSTATYAGRYDSENRLHLSADSSDAQWLLHRLPACSRLQLQADPAGLQWVINSVRQLRAQHFVQGRLISDGEILAGMNAARYGAPETNEAHRAYHILYALMQGNPYGRLPF